MRRLFSVFLFSVILCLSVPVSAQNLAAIRSQVANQQNTIDSLRHVLRGIEKNMEEDRQRQFENSERIQERARQDYGFYVQHVSCVMGLYGVGVALLVAIVGFLVPFMYNKMLRNDLKKCRKQAISAAGQVRLASIRMSELEKQIVVLQDQLEEMKSIRDTVEKIQEKIEISEKATYAAARKAEISKLFAEAYNEKDYKKQIELYTKLINLDPELAVAYLDRGYVYCNMNMYDNALNDFNKMIELDPANPDGYSNRGAVYGYLGKYQAALVDYNKAIELDPNHAASFNNRANVYLRQRKIKQAMADIQKVFEIENANANAAQYDTRGCIYLEKKEYDLAIKDFTRAIELNPKGKEFYENRARAYRELAGIETETEKQQTYREAEEADRAMVRKLSEDEVA